MFYPFILYSCLQTVSKTEHEIVKSQYDAYHAYSPEAVTGYRNWTQETEKTIRAEDTYPSWGEVIKTTTDETSQTKIKSRSLTDDRDRNSFVEAFAHVTTEIKQLEGTKKSVGQGGDTESTEASKYRHTSNSIGKIHQKETRTTTNTESSVTSGTYKNQTLDRTLDRTYVGTNGAVEVIRYTSKDPENRATTTTNRQSYDIDAGYTTETFTNGNWFQTLDYSQVFQVRDSLWSNSGANYTNTTTRKLTYRLTRNFVNGQPGWQVAIERETGNSLVSSGVGQGGSLRKWTWNKWIRQQPDRSFAWSERETLQEPTRHSPIREYKDTGIFRPDNPPDLFNPDGDYPGGSPGGDFPGNSARPAPLILGKTGTGRLGGKDPLSGAYLGLMAAAAAALGVEHYEEQLSEALSRPNLFDLSPGGEHNPDILDEFDRAINKVSDSFLPGLGENLDEVNRLLDPNNINRGNVPVIELPDVRDGGFDLGDRSTLSSSQQNIHH